MSKSKKMTDPIVNFNFDAIDWDKVNRESFKEARYNPENMSYWLPTLRDSKTRHKSILKVPETKIVILDYETWVWLRSDSYSEDKVRQFDAFLESAVGDFLEGHRLFMKSGIFSDKFTFSGTQVTDRSKIGYQFLDMYYQSLILGADKTDEVVLREYIGDKEDRGTIYSGMPLRTEFRVFYDFDNKEVVGVANYWHPEEMKNLYALEDRVVYEKTKEKLVNEFDELKYFVAGEVDKHLKEDGNLTGKWSVDVMKNGEDYWLIDMARMERSALTNRMEKLNITKGVK